jgi:hypothetical protein
MMATTVISARTVSSQAACDDCQSSLQGWLQLKQLGLSFVVANNSFAASSAFQQLPYSWQASFLKSSMVLSYFGDHWCMRATNIRGHTMQNRNAFCHVVA